DAQLERLREETARLRIVERDLVDVQREAAALALEARTLRAEAFVARSSSPKPRVVDVPTTGSRGDALQTIVDRETRRERIHSAVIADELGLVVVSSGGSAEFGDALAAFGAYLAEVGQKTCDVLPLHEVREVVVRDDHDVTLTVSPIEVVDTTLAL